jgi:glycosyltransferase involved in cell wall biosynthesis
MKDKISIITPIYNRLNWLPLTIISILSQTYDNYEVIFVNDGGDTPEEIIMDHYSDKFMLFHHGVNKGLPEARNTGLKHATGDYFVFLDSDDILLPLALEFRLSMMKKYEAEIVYTRALQNIYEMKDNNYQMVHRQLYWDSNYDKDLILIQNIAPCNAVMFSRKAWDDADNYMLDGKLNSGEDYDTWCALSRKNDFVELKLVDCECSYRQDMTQMTGTRNFAKDLPRIYKRWRKTAKNIEWVTEHQNNVLRNAGIKPEDYGL